MFRTLFLATLAITLAVNLLFLLFAARDKPPDLIAARLVAVESTYLETVTTNNGQQANSSMRRLFLRSNDFYDYTPLTNETDTPTNQESSLIDAAAAAAAAPIQPVFHLRPLAPGADGAATQTQTRTRTQTQTQLQMQMQTQTPAPERQKHSSVPMAADGKQEDKQQHDDWPPITTFAYDNYVVRHEASTATSDNSNSARSLRVRVKSSKSHVLVSLNGALIYQCGKASSFTRHRRRRRRRRANSTNRKWADTREEKAIEWTDEAEDGEAEAEATRGIHVLVLNEHNGALMSRRRFDTYTAQQDEELALYLSQLRAGRLLVFAVKDEGSFKMARQSAARRLLRALGSRHINALGWRDMWAMVTRKRDLLETGRQIGESSHSSGTGDMVALAEAISHSGGVSRWAEPVEVEAVVPIVVESNQKNSSSEQLCHFEEARRRSFCARLEGYARLCDCRARPSPIDFRPPVIPNSRLTDVPIVVIASDRPYYLHRMLRSLLEARGVQAHQVVVFIDGFHWEPAELCKLFQLRYVQRAPIGKRSARISSHYKASLSETFERLFPQAQHAIILEEDLEVAPDALVYFNEMLPLLQRDSTLYCISAWNDQGYEHSVGHLGQVYRVETMPGLGWLLARELFERELAPAWPSPERQHDWDMWIRTAAVRRNRECLIPDVSRTFHFGATGTNINVHFQRQYFSKHAFSANYPIVNNNNNNKRLNQPTGTPFGPLDELQSGAYDEMLARIITSESRLISWRHHDDAINSFHHRRRPAMNASLQAQLERQFLCSLVNSTHQLETGTSDSNWISGSGVGGQFEPSVAMKMKTNVIFVKMIDGEDFANWLQLARCWRLWDLDARGQHKAVWRLYLNGTATLVVGHPASPFSKLKPAHLEPFDLREAPPPA